VHIAPPFYLILLKEKVAKRKGLGIKRNPNGFNAITLFFIAQSLKR